MHICGCGGLLRAAVGLLLLFGSPVSNWRYAFRTCCLIRAGDGVMNIWSPICCWRQAVRTCCCFKAAAASSCQLGVAYAVSTTLLAGLGPRHPRRIQQPPSRDILHHRGHLPGRRNRCRGAAERRLARAQPAAARGTLQEVDDGGGKQRAEQQRGVQQPQNAGRLQTIGRLQRILQGGNGRLVYK